MSDFGFSHYCCIVIEPLKGEMLFSLNDWTFMKTDAILKRESTCKEPVSIR